MRSQSNFEDKYDNILVAYRLNPVAVMLYVIVFHKKKTAVVFILPCKQMLFFIYIF